MQGPYPRTLSTKEHDDFNFHRVLQCFLALAMYPFALKGYKKVHFLINAPFDRFSLAMYPPEQIFLKASILRGVRGDAAGPGGLIAAPF